MELLIEVSGCIRCVYDEQISLASLGEVTIQRGSHVEPTTEGNWIADLTPVDGPVLGPFSERSQAIAAEVRWLQRYWLLSNRQE
ncbi:hypothetical protein Pan97_07440 [Bremerella volcania]|uniref:Uncharacterized protein n=1 Tax=Bremerella volcania TaxID=2527984 RepID=A0A518C3F0_9BACT|nr:hypothetical protein Pan97_07440 [Bremerella volcania]